MLFLNPVDQRARRVPPEESGVPGPRAPGIDGPRHAWCRRRLVVALKGKSEAPPPPCTPRRSGCSAWPRPCNCSRCSRAPRPGTCPCGRGWDGRPPSPVPREQRRLGRLCRQRPALRRGADRRPAALESGREPARPRAARGRAPDHRHGGHPRRADVLHARRAPGPAVVGAAGLRRDHRRARGGPVRARRQPASRAVRRPGRAAQPRRSLAPRLPRAGRRPRPDRAQLPDPALHRRRGVALRLDRGAHRDGHHHSDPWARASVRRPPCSSSARTASPRWRPPASCSRRRDGGALFFAAWAAGDWLMREGRRRGARAPTGPPSALPAPAASGRPGPGDPPAARLHDPAAPVGVSGVRPSASRSPSRSALSRARRRATGRSRSTARPRLGEHASCMIEPREAPTIAASMLSADPPIS